MKITVLLINPHAWISLVKRLYTNTQMTSAVALATAGLVLFLLIRSGLDIVQILAVCLFVCLLILVGFAPYVPRLYDWVETQDMRQWLKRTVALCVGLDGVASLGRLCVAVFPIAADGANGPSRVAWRNSVDCRAGWKPKAL